MKSGYFLHTNRVTFLDCESGCPVSSFEQVQTDVSFGTDIGVVDLCDKSHLDNTYQVFSQ